MGRAGRTKMGAVVPSGKPPTPYVLDSNAFDDLTRELGLISLLAELLDAGEIELITNRLVHEELMRTGDDLKRFRFGLLQTDDGPLPFTIGRSALGGPDVIVSKEESDAITAAKTSPKHQVDAYVLGLAVRHDAALVTADKRLANRAQEANVEVLTGRELLDRLGLFL